MGMRRNADGSVTVGCLEDVKISAEAEAKPEKETSASTESTVKKFVRKTVKK